MAKKSKSTNVISGSRGKTIAFPAWQVLIFMIVFGALGVYTIANSWAAPGGRGGKSTKTLSITPNPVSANKSIQISLSGCGYDTSPYTITNVGIQREGFGAFGYNTGVMPDGCLDPTPYPKNIDENNYFALPAGTYTVTIKQAIGGRAPKNPDSQTTLVVQ